MNKGQIPMDKDSALRQLFETISTYQAEIGLLYDAPNKASTPKLLRLRQDIETSEKNLIALIQQENKND